jgi:hypothetical protein
MSHNFLICNADTDSIAFKKPDEKPFTPEERQELLNDINLLMPELIRWEDDSFYKKFIVVGSKNYVLQDPKGNVKLKGSGLKATTKEKALRRFIKEVIDLLLKDRKDHIYCIYTKYAHEILSLKDISDWCSKKTVTKAVLGAERTNEKRVLEALRGSDFNEGDKVYMFFKTPEELCLRENFSGEYDVDTLLGKLYDTLSIFDKIIDIDCFPNFSLKRNKSLLPKSPLNQTISLLNSKETFPAGYWQTRDTH